MSPENSFEDSLGLTPEEIAHFSAELELYGYRDDLPDTTEVLYTDFVLPEFGWHDAQSVTFSSEEGIK